MSRFDARMQSFIETVLGEPRRPDPKSLRDFGIARFAVASFLAVVGVTVMVVFIGRIFRLFG